MKRKAEVLARETVYDGYFRLEEVSLRHSRFDGGMSPAMTRLNLVVGEVAAVLLVKPERRRVVLVEQFRYATLERDGGWLVEIVAGRVDAGETPEDAARREVLEETGYRVRDLHPVRRFYPACGTLAEHVTLYYAEVADADRTGDGGGYDADEDILTVEWAYDDLWRALDDGALIDAKTVIAAQWLRRRLEAE